MGYYQMDTRTGRLNTKAGRDDPIYVEIFDQMRDLEYNIAQARLIASEACYWLKIHPDWTKEQAIKECFK